MPKLKFELVETDCKRCGRKVTTGSRSLHGADGLKAELGGICSRCIKPEEETRILDGQAEAILSRATHAY